MMLILCGAFLVVAWSGPSRAAERWLESSEWQRWDLVDTFGQRPARSGEVGEVTAGGVSLLSGTSLKSAGLSLLVPGLGQMRNGQRGKGLIMLGVEAAIWGTYAGFHRHAGTLSDDYEAWASIYAGVPSGQSDSFYQTLGRYDSSDDWYDSRRREARAFGDPDPVAPGPAEQWQWRSEQARRDYQLLRADADRAYNRRDRMVLFAVINRAISMFDAVRNGQREADAPASLGARILGTDLALEVSAPLAEPEAQLSAGWSF